MLRKEVIEEEARFRQVYIRFYVAKVNQLSLRFCQGEPKVKDRWKGVGVTSEQLRKEKEEQGLNATKNFITLENLKVDRQEEAYLNLPYKFREFQPLNSTDFEIECEARDTKRRWELINRTPPDENLPDLGGGEVLGKTQRGMRRRSRLGWRRRMQVRSMTERGTFLNRPGKKLSFLSEIFIIHAVRDSCFICSKGRCTPTMRRSSPSRA